MRGDLRLVYMLRNRTENIFERMMNAKREVWAVPISFRVHEGWTVRKWDKSPKAHPLSSLKYTANPFQIVA